MAEWTWEPDDFAALWYSDANDRFPRPLHYLSRFRYLEEFEAHREKVCNSYPFDEWEQIRLAIHTLTTSDVRIEILGGTTRTKNAAVRQYRLLGARNPHHAVVLSQSVVDDTDGPIRLRMCRPEHLPTRIINWLLPADPGTQPAATFHEQDTKPDRNGYSDEAARNSPRDRYRRLLGRPANGGGSAALYTGSILDRPDPWNTLQWHDIADDGRYTELRKIDQINVRPTTPQDLATQFTTWIDNAVQRLREDEDW
ncbi:ESX secretion-associated protein EspG [Nocardia sp. NPDC046473]|uniref:ESX secretion-associated protein EspG n=1 Tax=Nocardia sp. NPDC046473 TaxID=3155733 RepID=UPI0033D3AC10